MRLSLKILTSFIKILSFLSFGFVFVFAGCRGASSDSGNDSGNTVLEKVYEVVLGQLDFQTGSARLPFSETTLGSSDFKITSCGRRLIVSDFDNNRVLIWNSFPESNNQAPDIVLGQPNFLSNQCSSQRSASTLCRPGGVSCNENKLAVAEYNTKRVLIWNQFPTSNFAPADLVLGQVDFSSSQTDSPSVPYTMVPYDVKLTESKLIVTDYGKRRILIWNSIPSSNNQPADVVVGHSDFVMTPPSDLAAGRLSGPYESFTDGVRLFVADSGNNRVLIWNTIPTTNGKAADVVVGQQNFSANDTQTVNQHTLKGAYSLFVHNKSLFVLDSEHSRILKWNSIPTTNYAPADMVFGQPNFTSSTPNTGAVSAETIGGWGEGLWLDDRRLIYGDPENRRVIVLSRERLGF